MVVISYTAQRLRFLAEAFLLVFLGAAAFVASPAGVPQERQNV
jgi:hypothetical protein